jgi:hypothetical protein
MVLPDVGLRSDVCCREHLLRYLDGRPRSARGQHRKHGPFAQSGESAVECWDPFQGAPQKSNTEETNTCCLLVKFPRLNEWIPQAGRRRYLTRACVHFTRELVLSDGFSRLDTAGNAAALRFYLKELKEADDAIRQGKSKVFSRLRRVCLRFADVHCCILV